MSVLRHSSGGPLEGRTQSPRELAMAERIRILNPSRIGKAVLCVTDPRISQAAASLKDALPWVDVSIVDPGALSEMLADRPFVLITDDAGCRFLDRGRFKANNPQDAVVVLLSTADAVALTPPAEAEKSHSYAKKADLIFYINAGDCAASSVLAAAIRCAEDKINIERYSKAKRFIFLVVDDQPCWFSQFLPVLYRIIGQRADVMTARTYEEAERAVREHGDDIICIITDINIPRDGRSGPHGKDLVDFARAQCQRVPVIVASKCEEANALRDAGCFHLPKGDDGALRDLEWYVRDFTGLGDFLFYMDGQFAGRASNLKELRDEVARLPVEVLELYAGRDYFSTWLYMHGFGGLGDLLRPRQDRGQELREVLLQSIDRELEDVARQPFIFLDDEGRTVAEAWSLAELAGQIRKIDIATLESYSHIDGFSTWLMRKGYTRLADELRPLHTEGEELRERILRLVEKELESADEADRYAK